MAVSFCHEEVTNDLRGSEALGKFVKQKLEARWDQRRWSILWVVGNQRPMGSSFYEPPGWHEAQPLQVECSGA